MNKGASTLAVTMDDVAHRAGVSRATVSRVLGRTVPVSDRAREKVLKAIHELGYLPNMAASQLANGVSPVLGLLLRAPNVPTYGLLHIFLQAATEAAGLQLVTVVPTPGAGPESESESLRRLLGLRVGGLLVATGAMVSDLLGPFLSAVPVVAVGRLENHPRVHSVSYDEVAHGTMLADQVLAYGHQRIAVLTPTLAVSGAEHIRGLAMLERLRAQGATAIEVPVTRLGVRGEGSEAIVTLARAHDITAAMFPSDIHALSFMELAVKVGIRIPEDLSVTGCDGVSVGLSLTGLATLRVPVETVARRSVQVMQELVRRGGFEVCHELHTGVLVDGRTLSVPFDS